VFEPRPFGFSRRRTGSDQNIRNTVRRDRIPRRYSGSYHPRTPKVRASSRESPNRSTPRRRTTGSSSVPPSIYGGKQTALSSSAMQFEDANSEDDELSRRMKELLGEDGEDLQSKDRMNMFSPSESMVQKRIKRAEERKARKREAAILEARQRRLTRRWPKKALIAPLEPVWDAKVDRLVSQLASASESTVISQTLKGIDLNALAFRRLLGKGSWLSDESINAYIEFAVEAGNEAIATDMSIIGEKPSTLPKIIAHNSFFWPKLTTHGPASTIRLMKRMKVEGSSLLEVDTILVPVNLNSHWTLIVVRPVARTIEYLDSLGGSHHKFVYHMKEWLKTILGKAYIDSEWTVLATKCAIQSNGYDCGVFLCTNALCVIFGLDTWCYKGHDMTQQRKNIAAVLLNRGFQGAFAWEGNGI
jgi:sentrin-specific protease 1